MEKETKKNLSFHSYEILCFWQSETCVNFVIATDCGKEVTISITAYEFLQWFDNNQINEIKNKLIETINNK